VSMPGSKAGTMLGIPTFIGFPESSKPHGFAVDDIVDIYWGGDKISRGATVKSVSENFIDFQTSPPAAEPSEGDVGIPELAPVRVSHQQRVTVDVDPTVTSMIGVSSSRESYVDFRDSSGSLYVQKIAASNRGWLWLDEFAWNNLLDGGTNIIEFRVSNARREPGRFNVFFLHDN